MGSPSLRYRKTSTPFAYKPIIQRCARLNQVPRMRVFAGPNGSGKSTIIQAVREYRISVIPLDFGVYINAGDIAEKLRNNRFYFANYEVTTTRKEFISLVLESGLIGKNFNEKAFRSSVV